MKAETEMIQQISYYWERSAQGEPWKMLIHINSALVFTRAKALLNIGEMFTYEAHLKMFWLLGWLKH